MKTHNHHLVPKHRGGTDDDGMVSVSITQHAMFHFCEWRLWGHWQDKCAWMALTGQMNTEEISEELKKQRYKKLSEVVSGVPKSEAHKNATSIANKKAYQNEEVIERCRVSKLSKSKKVYCITTGETF